MWPGAAPEGLAGPADQEGGLPEWCGDWGSGDRCPLGRLCRGLWLRLQLVRPGEVRLPRAARRRLWGLHLHDWELRLLEGVQVAVVLL